MNIETIIHKGKKVLKKTKNNGSISYTIKGAYIGIDSKTGKKITSTITSRTLKGLDRELVNARLNFEENGSTRKENIQINNFSELAEVWFESYQNLVSSENTINRVRGYVYTYIIPKFGDYIPSQIEPSDIQIWVDFLAKNARESIDLELSAKKGKAQDFGAVIHKLSDIFDFGITNFGLEKNPVSTVKIPPRPKSNKKRIKVLHDDELSTWIKFLATLPNNRANNRFKLICDTLLASGLRINELLALTIADLDSDLSEISVSKTLMWKNANKKTGTKGRMICKPTPKTDAGNREVAVPNEIIKNLREWYDETTNYFDKHELPKSDLIFPTIHGNFMTDRNERKTLGKRLKLAGLTEYGFHLFRHTHASLLLNAGANWKELQVRLGHKSIMTTMDLYAELAPKKKTETVNLFVKKMESLSA